VPEGHEEQRTPLDPDSGSHAVREGGEQPESNDEQRGKDDMELRGEECEMEQDEESPDGETGPRQGFIYWGGGGGGGKMTNRHNKEHTKH